MRQDLMIVSPIYFSPEGGAARADTFAASVASWRKHFRYSPFSALFILAVHDGPIPDIWDRIPDVEVASRMSRSGLGASLNQGLDIAFKDADLALHMVDDFELTAPYDLEPWVDLLKEREDIGAVNLSAPFPGCTGTITPLGTTTWGVMLNRHNLAAGLRPTLYHRRFFDAYGKFDEDINAWETERLFNERFCAATGPESVLALPFPWNCTSPIETGRIEPCDTPAEVT